MFNFKSKNIILLINGRGESFWFKDNDFHRPNGPAVILANDSKFWYKDGQRHRLDGPAVIHSNGYKAWYKDGKYVRQEFAP